MEQELKEAGKDPIGHAVPEIEPGVKEENDNIPRISKMQIELMVQSFAADFACIAKLQYTNSVGGAKMHWIEVSEGHLSGTLGLVATKAASASESFNPTTLISNGSIHRSGVFRKMS